MCEDSSRVERAKRFSKIWWKSRADAEKSQEFVALGLGVSKKTIQNWEKGLSAPNLFQATEWFRVLGLNPTKYYLEFLYPKLFDDASLENEEQLDETLINLIKNISFVEKKQLIYLISGSHGSSWIALLQLFSVYCQISFQARVAAARVILENYDVEEKTGRLVNPENLKPDLKLINLAISKCKLAAQNGHSGYLIDLCDEVEQTLDSKSKN